MSQKKIAILGALLCFSAALAWFLTRDQKKGPPKGKEVAQQVKSASKSATQPDKKVASSNRKSDGAMELLFDDDPKGALRLEGQVIDGSESPVAGAVVSIDSRPPRFVITEEDGSFFFEGLVGKSYDVVARSSEGVAGPITVRLTGGNDPVIMALVAGGQVSVVVVTKDSPDGISDVSVELRGLDVQRGTTDAEGVVVFSQVPMGRYQVVAKFDGYAPGRARLSVSRAGATADARITLKAGARVSGRVIDPDGKAVAGARVIYGGASSWGQRASPRLDGVLSGKDGAFSFDALPGGSFRFTATADGFASGSSSLVSLDAKSETTGVEVIMEPGATLEGFVMTLGGDPVAAARVRVAIQSSGRMGPRSRTRQAFTDDNGHYELSELQRAKYEVVAIHESGSSEIAQIDLGKAPHKGTLTLNLSVDGIIAGIVVDSTGEPISGAQVMVSPNFLKTKDQSFAKWRMRGMDSELTDTGGRFRVSGLEDDEFYSVRVTPAGVSTRGRAWMGEPTEARAGDEDLRIVLPADGGISGKVVLAGGGSPTSFTVTTGWRQGTPFAADDGAFELADLPPQEFTVTIRGPGFEQHQIPNVMVEEGKISDLGTVTVTVGRTVSGRVIDANGTPVQGAIVSAGRVIFGDGSSAKASGGNRNPMARDTKTTTTGENGGFEIFGVSLGDLSIVADHETAGRSLPISMQMSNESMPGIELVLLKTGALQGVVRKAGTPEPDVILIATSTKAPGVTFNVATGQDGSYRFDRLVPDEYRVKGMMGGNPMAGMTFFAELVRVESEQTATLDLNMDDDGATLTIMLEAQEALGFSMLSMVPGQFRVKTARELYAKTSSSVGFEGGGMSIRGKPATVKNLKPDVYTVCVIVYPNEVTGMAGTMDYIKREGDNLPAQCQEVTVSAEPEQSMVMKVILPEYVPAPGEVKSDEGPSPNGSSAPTAN